MKKESDLTRPDKVVTIYSDQEDECEAWPFIKTAAWEMVRNACAAALIEHGLIVITGNPGMGKTRCLLEYAKREMPIPPLFLACRTQMRAGDLIRKIAHELELDARQSAPKLEAEIIARLKQQPQALFIDDADRLNERGLATLSHLWDQAQVAVVLAGEPGLYERIKSIEMVESRVSAYWMLADLSDEEITSLLRKVAGDRLSQAELATIRRLTGGTFKQVGRLLLIVDRLLALKAAGKEAN